MTRQKMMKMRSLLPVNEQSEPFFNAVSTTQSAPNPLKAGYTKLIALQLPHFGLTANTQAKT